MIRIPLITGNWKMYKTGEEAARFIASLVPQIASTERRVLIAASFTALESAAKAAQGTRIAIGAQNMHDQQDGAFTGETSARMLKASGASFVILGHSERREHFLETNTFIHRKIKRALAEGLIPLLCIGETLIDREQNRMEKVLALQLEECLQGLTPEEFKRLMIAYEPIWAIGTGRTATPAIAQTTHRWIRNFLENLYGKENAAQTYLLYGGSVKPDNIAALMQETDIDGVLVGGASLDPSSFAKIINY